MGKPFTVVKVDDGMVTLEIPLGFFIDETGDPGSRVSPGDQIDLSAMIFRNFLYPTAGEKIIDRLMVGLRAQHDRRK